MDSLFKGYIGVGALAAVFASISTLFGMMEEMLLQNLGGALERALIAANLLRILDKPERSGNELPNLSDGIRLVNVSFAYPNANEPCIKGASFDMKRGETLLSWAQTAPESQLL